MAEFRRRQFLIAASAIIATPLAAEAQHAGKVYRIGYLGGTASTPETLALRDAFRQGLRERGWVEGQNLVIEYRWAEGKFERLSELAAELVRLKVDLIFAGSSIYVEPARRATQTIPIVFALHADPVGSGHVASLGRPGGNITGLSLMQSEFTVKGLQLLKEVVPQATRIAVLWNPATPSHGPGLKAIEAAALALGVRVQSLAVLVPEDFEGAFAAMARERAEALLVIGAAIFFTAQHRLADLAIKHRLPAMFGTRGHAVVGGLLSYAANYPDLMRRSAAYVDKILKGARPGDLPVEQSTKFELVVNLKTARSLGITIPQSMKLRADELIQ